MTEALKLIKNEFGSQAVILSAKTIKKSTGIFGAVRKAGVEITAASDRYHSTDFKTQAEYNNEQNENSGARNNIHLIPKSATFKEYHKKKRKLEDASKFNRTQMKKQLPPLITKLQLNLEEQGVSQEIIRKIVNKVTWELRFKDDVTAEDIGMAFNRVISDKITMAKPIDMLNEKPSIVAFVGPTGVGKTTTIAKLSAQLALEKKRSVALISMDCQRIGAALTLEKYAQIIRLPYKTVSSEQELLQTVKLHKDYQYIFVDTPGLAMGDKGQIEQLANQLTNIAPNEVHLLLSAVTKDQDMDRIYSAYTSCRVNRLIFTKIDETLWVGNIFNILYKKGVPLSYVTNGQHIPDHITSTRIETITELLLNVSKANEHSDIGHRKRNLVDSPQSKSLPSGDYYIANRNSDIFHHRKCKSVQRINTNNVIIFRNFRDAQKQSFKPCRMCCFEKIRNDRSLLKFKQKVAVSR